jgi:nucleotide-binding universal stress UspA family protein
MTPEAAMTDSAQQPVLPVLLAIGAEGSFDAGLRFAACEATTRGCGLLLLHAYHVLPTGPETAELAYASPETVARRRLREATEHSTNVLAGQVELGTLLRRGHAVQTIVEASADSRLVVLQRRDLSDLRRVVTRSTSSGVAAHAHTPVAVVPEGWTPDDGRNGVVVGVDVPSRSHAILHQALTEARARRGSLRVLHTWWSPGYIDDLDMDRSVSRSWADETAGEIQAVVDELRDGTDDVPVEIETHHGRPAQVLVDASRSADLVVVGRHDPLVPVGSHLGPVARAVLRAAECPVLLVSPAPSAHNRTATRAEEVHRFDAGATR